MFVSGYEHDHMQVIVVVKRKSTPVTPAGYWHC
jgi:hypothetical protein